MIVSSALAQHSIDFRSDPFLLNCSIDPSSFGFKIYGTTKLMNVLTARSLAEKLKDRGVIVNAVHPGIIKTDLHSGDNDTISNTIRGIMYTLIGIEPWQGAQPMLHLATSPDAAVFSGEYVHGILPRPIPSPLGYDRELQEFLWKKSLEVTGAPDL